MFDSSEKDTEGFGGLLQLDQSMGSRMTVHIINNKAKRIKTCRASEVELKDKKDERQKNVKRMKPTETTRKVKPTRQGETVTITPCRNNYSSNIKSNLN